MSAVEKVYVSILVISFISLLFMGGYFYLGFDENIDASILFILMFFYAVPSLILKRKLIQEMDEMAKEISRRSILISLQVTWIFIAFAIAGLITFSGKYIKTVYVEFMFFGWVWVMLTTRAIATLIFYKKGIEK